MVYDKDYDVVRESKSRDLNLRFVNFVANYFATNCFVNFVVNYVDSSGSNAQFSSEPLMNAHIPMDKAGRLGRTRQIG